MAYNRLPMKYQIYEALKKTILNGTLKSGDMLQSEAELCRKFNVSKTTVIAALQMLQNDSLIYRQQGKGTFVSQPKLSRDLSSSKTRFFGMVESDKNIKPTTQILQVRSEFVDNEIASALKIQPDDKVVFLKRLRLIDNIPVAITWSYMVWEYGEKLLLSPLKENFSITEYIRNEYLQEPISGTVRLTVERIYGADARLLNVEDGFTCCRTVSTSYIGKKKFELAYTVMRADKFEFIIKKIDY